MWFIERYKKKYKNLVDRENYKFFYNLNRKIFYTNYNTECREIKKQGGGDQEILVSLTTHSKRINYIHFVLDSLYHQLLRPDSVYLYLTRNEYENLPEILNNFKPWLKIAYTDNIGSYKKFIPALRASNSNQIIISLDDDFLYPHHLILSLYSLYKEHNDKKALFAFNGIDWEDNPNFGVGGGLGILWNPQIFNINNTPMLFDEKKFLQKYANQDDAWIAECCKHYAIHIHSLCDKDYNASYLDPDFISLPSSHYLAISKKTL